MIPTLKSEFRKFLTVRSTYIVTGLVLILIPFLSVYIFGYENAARKPDSPDFILDSIYTMLSTFVTFSTILAILLVAHEYRYNMITYTLTSSRSRLRVLLAKAIVMLVYATVIGLVVALLAYVGTRLGASLAGHSVAPQHLPIGDMVWQFGANVWGYTLAGLIIALLIRGVVGSVVVFFLVPTAEGILSLLLKSDAKYLPFRALDAIAATPQPEVAGMGIEVLSHGAALTVFMVYLVVFGTAAVVMFIRRDAN